MAEELIIKCCAPTLAGLKLGSIFCLSDFCKDTGYELKKCVKILKAKGLEVKGIIGSNGQRLIYLYRPGELERMVSNKTNACLLANYGYNTKSAEAAVRCLLNRIKSQKEFPHEIGLFLGYPYSDVIGYINNEGKNFIFSDMWKVYSNEENAKVRINCYKKCTRVYTKCYKSGTCFDRLVIKK